MTSLKISKSPDPEYIWIPGHWQRSDNMRESSSGYEEYSHQSKATWVAGQWAEKDGAWYWVEGHWSIQ